MKCCLLIVLSIAHTIQVINGITNLQYISLHLYSQFPSNGWGAKLLSVLDAPKFSPSRKFRSPFIDMKPHPYLGE